MRCLLVFVFFAASEAVTWIKSPAGVSCDEACASRSGCSENDWPTSEEEFWDVAKLAGQECDSVQEGESVYDPSTDGNHCGWKGAEHLTVRCDQKGDDMSYRFCPCNSDREL
mmetsp:Transcript_20345/g.36350  ORF Transcript_20345/g.36350 Transcript_20345/m.36350 type:complete len:112 (-) Transcript_20345:125-460(-)